MSMNIIVCIKQVPDPEAHSSCFIINDNIRVETCDVATILNPFDENALEAALKIKDTYQGEIKITVLSLGHSISLSLMQKTLATGADELVLVDDEMFASGHVDSHITVYSLAAAIKKIGKYDVILLGRQSADLNAGQTAIGLGHTLNLPVITMANSIEITNNHLLSVRNLLTRQVKVECPLPVVVMVNSDNGMIRYPTFPQILASKKKPVTIWNHQDLGLDLNKSRQRLVLRKLYKPDVLCRKCIIIEGETIEKAAENLAQRLWQDHIV